MKFANELERDAVPEWRAKYLNYKVAKKRLKPVTAAIRDINRTPRTPSFRNVAYTPPANVGTGLLNNSQSEGGQQAQSSSDDTVAPDQLSRTTSQRSKSYPAGAPQPTTTKAPPSETEPLVINKKSGKPGEPGRLARYGSIIGSPPEDNDFALPAAGPPSLKLPDPAISPSLKKKTKKVRLQGHGEDLGRSAYEAGRTNTPDKDKSASRIKTRRWSSWDRGSMRRLFSKATGTPNSAQANDYPLDAYNELETAQKHFFRFLDSELDKVEQFYKDKEDEATHRLTVLREQLHILRDRRLEDLSRAKGQKKRPKGDSSTVPQSDSDDLSKIKHRSWIPGVDRAWEAAVNGRVGKRTKGLESQTTPEGARPLDDRRDYVRRVHEHDIPYRTAKSKLKVALREFYRSLELLKSYALLNRTAFRKINKKYDKTVNASPPQRYMSDKVNKAWFVKSDVIDGHIHAVEDLYARYFEAGNHKVAANKLRQATKMHEYHGGAMFRNGFYLALGAVFSVQGLVSAIELLYNSDRSLVNQTSFLLQIYGGYFLMLLLMLLFCLACQFWSKSKVNYVFVFEFDTRDFLNWRQLYEIPCLYFSFLGFFMWITFTRYGADEIYIYFPVLLVFLTFITLFLPVPILYSRTRVWFLNSCWRLFWSGLYPVEFRDFFLGDMFCSLTYSMGNIEIFFCLYAQYWQNTAQCNSSHSRLLGFFSALPGVWRALQCLRRYYDTRNFFPHLVNCGKYSFTILFYVSLSLYRIDKGGKLFAFMIFAGVVNGIYCSLWDLVMDWSLLNPYAKNRYLRTTLAFKQKWLYYVAIVIDPILRFNWIFYAIFAGDVQHSAVLSFVIALSEVSRRGLWMLFRVENEHCTNVTRFRAARDVPLPFETGHPSPSSLEAGTASGILEPPSTAQQHLQEQLNPSSDQLARINTGSDRSGYQTSPSLRRRRPDPSPLVRGLTRVGSILHTAHAQDFERRKKDKVIGEYAFSNESSDDEIDETAKTLDEAEALNKTDSSEEEAPGPAGLKVKKTRPTMSRDGSSSGDSVGPKNGNGKDRAMG